MFYNHQEIEKKWQKFWEENQTYKTENNSTKPKFYVLDMFPYPSGAGLHVGHPLGYIASDIYARFKRHQGFNVLHPIGYDSFGLPAEQYAIQTGQHPAITTEQNITRYEEQLRKIGFSFDWSREVRTSDASYYKWTQWIFIELFHSWYNKTSDKAESIETLVEHFSKFGTENLNAVQNDELNFTAEEWNAADENKKQDILLNYRLAYRAETTVNWCPALGTKNLYFLDVNDPSKMVKYISVAGNTEVYDQLNELEYYNGFVYANVWQKPIILKINPKSGEVVARIDFSEIVKKHNTGTDDVLNGIAFKGQNMLVTGKNWDKIYEVKIK